jgi:multicomponent Na+:H+ antiporter subunit G
MSQWIVSAFLLIGGGLLFLAALGVLRMPDLYTRMQAATKAGTLGVGLVLAAAAMAFGELEATITALLAIGFFLLTAPVAAHMLGRAAYLAHVRLWSRTVRDEWSERNGLISERR